MQAGICISIITKTKGESIMEYLLPLIIQLVSGAVGGNVAGSLMKDKSLGTLWNSIVGIVGGGIGGQILSLLGIATSGGGMDIGSIIGSIVGGGVLMAIVGVIKKHLANKKLTSQFDPKRLKRCSF